MVKVTPIQISVTYFVVFIEAKSAKTEFTKLNSANNAGYVESIVIQHMTNHSEWIIIYTPFVAQTWGVQVANDTITYKGAGEVMKPSILMFANVVVLTFGVYPNVASKVATNHLSGTKSTNPKVELKKLAHLSLKWFANQ